MAMVDVDDSCQFSADSLTTQVDWLGLRVGGHPALGLHSSDEPGELSSLNVYTSDAVHDAQPTLSKRHSFEKKSAVNTEPRLKKWKLDGLNGLHL